MQRKHGYSTSIMLVIGMTTTIFATGCEDDFTAEEVHDVTDEEERDTEGGNAEGEHPHGDHEHDSPVPYDASAPRMFSSPPCGDRLVASLPTQVGTVVDICLGSDGRFGYAEYGPLDTLSGVSDQMYECAVDLFLEIAPAGTPVPERLIEHCTRPMSSSEYETTREPRVVLAQRPWEVEESQDDIAFRSHYCDSQSGAVSFQNERCSAVQAAVSSCGFDCFSSCTTSLWTSAQRTCSEQMGTRGNIAYQQLASCSGATRFRAWRQNAGVGGFDGEADFDVNANFWGEFRMSNTAASDDDFRFRGDAYPGASFRHATAFEDFQWP